MGRQTWKKRIVKIEMLVWIVMSMGGMLFFGGDKWATMAVLRLEAPLVSYGLQDEEISLANLLTETLGKQSPLYHYCTEKGYGQTSVESVFSYGLRMRGKELVKKNKKETDAVMVVQPTQKDFRKAVLAKYKKRNLSSYSYLVSHFYHVDATTGLPARLLKFSDLFYRNLAVTPSKKKPRILLYHTHAHEEYRSGKQKRKKTVVDVGDVLTDLLENTYHIPVLHHKGVYDDNRNVAYSKALPNIEKILKENPSIEVVIDLHRDGIAPGSRLVSKVNGKKMAKIMFFNGVSYSKTLGPITYLKNPNLKENLAFSMQMQLAADTFYPGLSRGVYIKGYRYNMHLRGKNLLVEVGAQTNTYEEAKNSMVPLADLLHKVLQ